MQYSPPLIQGTLIKRYKRFLADVECPHLGRSLTVHCPNPGRMEGLSTPGTPIWIWDSQNPKRKLRYSLELVEDPEGALVVVNTMRANQVIHEALTLGLMPDFDRSTVRTEVPWMGTHTSRLDFQLVNAQGQTAFVEVKSVTYLPDFNRHQGIVAFPDAVTSRGTKHLNTLCEIQQSGIQAINLFLACRSDATAVTTAGHIDPQYSSALDSVLNHGVQVLAYRMAISVDGLDLGPKIPFIRSMTHE